ncbi:MAG: mobilization protein [Candidatus Contendobacter sp.]|jgi:predicted Zn-dependent protease|nr:mobilization protein [Candidatus Contendobacter sp.]
MPGIDDRIADLEKRLKQAKALKQQQVTRERAAEKKRQRSDDTRRKILVGAVILAKVDHGEWPKERLREWMDKALTRADDRALFGLLPVPSEAGTQTEPSVETAGAPRAS